MKQTLLSLIAATLLLASCGQKAPRLEDRNDSISWVVGRSVAESVKQSGIKFDTNMVLRAIEATLKGEEQPMSRECYYAMLEQLTMAVDLQQHVQAQDKLKEEQARQEEFFAQLCKGNKSIVKCDNGLYYEVLTPAKGRRPKDNEVVVFHYRAFNAYTNDLYDETYGRREPIRHVLGSPMLPAMVEALKMMPAGATYRFYIPFELAAGVSGGEAYVPMIYEFELLAVE